MSMFKNKFGKRNNKNYEDIHYSCTIRFLDDSEPISVTYQKDTKGQWLIDYVCKELNLVEKDYFGLRFVDDDKQRHWLDPFKAVHRQLKHVSPTVLCFRVKFYPSDPMKLREEITRYFLFLQLRRDLHHGRLLCSPADAHLLAAYIIQSEVGDYDPKDHPPGYITEFKMLPKQTQKQEDKIAEIHMTLAEQVPSEAESNFLKKAATLDTYGVDPHPVKDQKGNQMYLGVTHLGIVTFQGNKRTHLFKWPSINKIAFEGKMFIVHVTVSEGEEHSLTYKRKKHACGFKCPTFSACKHLWKCAVEQKYFFTLASSAEAPRVTSGGGLFSRGSKFRFSGRCQKEVYADSVNIKREEPSFVRSPSNPQFVRLHHTRSATLPAKMNNRSVDLGEVSETDELLMHPEVPEQEVADVEAIPPHGEEEKADSPVEPEVAAVPEAVQEEVILEGNHITPLEVPVVGHSPTQLEQEEPIDGAIPEEAEVTISDVPYTPLDSPEKEEAPPFVPDNVEETQTDLDAQIQELQNELDRCRVVDTNHINEVPVEEAKLVPQNTEPTAEEASPEAAPTSAAKPADKPRKKKGAACCCALLAAFMFLLLLVIVVAYFVLESSMEAPILTDLRGLPEVQDFKEQYYLPLKDSMGQKMGAWFKT